MAVASLTKPSYKPVTQIQPPCVDCTIPPECPEPSCAVELTAQCTEECVVIACNDPNHTESVCPIDTTQTHCNFLCEQTADCTDCTDFAHLFECCKDYPPYNSEQRPVPNSTSSTSSIWESASFEELWCPCGQPEPSDRQTHGSGTRSMDPQTSAHLQQRRTEDAYFQKGLEQELRSMQPSFQSFTFSTLTQPPLKPADLFSCMWGSCHATFGSLSDLIGHVNMHHLTNTLTMNSMAVNNSPLAQSAPSTSSADRIPCLWDNCGSSYSIQNDTMQSLSSHLLHEHFGLHPSPHSSIPCNDTPQIMSDQHSPDLPTMDIMKSQLLSDQDQSQQEIGSTESTPTPAENEHYCSGSHDCKWKDCGLTFHSCDSLTAHIASEHIGAGKAHYECFWEGCPRNGTQGFQSKQKISRHVQSHTGHRPFQCSICHQNFSEAATLQQHIRRHTHEKPYVCDYPGCNKSFAITGALTIHKRTHNGDKPFKCTYCDRGFAESSNLSKHLRTHTGVRPYQCAEPGCNKSFARPDQLNRHKAVHNKQLRTVS